MNDAKRCGRCKEVYGLERFPCNGRHALCRICAAAYAREYRKSKRGRQVTKAYLQRPDVIEKQRERQRRIPTEKIIQYRSNTRSRIMADRRQARGRLRRHIENGRIISAIRQQNRIRILTAEIERLNKPKTYDSN